MLATYLDFTTVFNANNGVKFDTSGWQNVAIEVSGSITGTVSITGSNDAGAITGVSDGNPLTSTNYTAITAINAATATGVTAISAAGNYIISNPPKFVQIGGASAATTGKVIVYMTTPV